MIDLYLMSPPSAGWALRGRANFRSREAPAVDAAAARREWLALAERIEALGGTVAALWPPSDELTGMPYAAECGHVVASDPGEPPRLLLPRMASPHRRAEKAHWAELARAMGLEPVEIGEGIWEAQGDVAELDGVTMLFFGGRTDRAGMEAAARHFRGELLRVEIREPAFHGNMAVLPIPAAEKLLACPDVIAPGSFAALVERFGRERILDVTEEEIRSYATNGLPIGDVLLAPSLVPARVVELVRGLGLRVELLAMRELCDKAGGASRCLVSHARVDPARVRVPPENRLAAVAARIRAEIGDA